MSESRTAEVIQFKPSVKSGKERGSTLKKDPGVAVCKSPIITTWLNRLSVTVSFHSDYFYTSFVDNALEWLYYGESNAWKLYRMKKPMEPSYVSYLVILQDFQNKNSAAVLATIVDRMIREVYLEEMKVCEEDINTYDLAKPYHAKLGEGTSINSKTRAALLAANLRTGQDLAQLTREQICAIPGMTTGEVVALEKSLVMRGLFLITRAPEL